MYNCGKYYEQFREECDRKGIKLTTFKNYVNRKVQRTGCKREEVSVKDYEYEREQYREKYSIIVEGIEYKNKLEACRVLGINKKSYETWYYRRLEKGVTKDKLRIEDYLNYLNDIEDKKTLKELGIKKIRLQRINK